MLKFVGSNGYFNNRQPTCDYVMCSDAMWCDVMLHAQLKLQIINIHKQTCLSSPVFMYYMLNILYININIYLLLSISGYCTYYFECSGSCKCIQVHSNVFHSIHRSRNMLSVGRLVVVVSWYNDYLCMCLRCNRYRQPHIHIAWHFIEWGRPQFAGRIQDTGYTQDRQPKGYLSQ